MPDLHDATRDLTAQTTEVVQRFVRGIVRAIHPLHREAEAAQVPIAGDVNRLEVTEQRRAAIPRCLLGEIHDVVAIERADGGELHVLERVELGQESFDGVADLEEAFFAPVDEVHLVHRDDEVRNAEQRREIRVTPSLLDHAEPRIDEDDGHVRRARARDHVARVLHMPRRVGDDELPLRRGEVTVGDIDGDALLAFGAKAVGEIGEIDLAATGDVSGTFERFDLIFHQRL